MLLQNGIVLQNIDSAMIFTKMDIRLRDHIISETGENLIPETGEECLDLKGDFVLPGMVNSHYHSYTNILRGTSFGEPLELWSADTVALGRILTEEDMSLSVSLGICEMLRAGVTACVDHLPHLSTAHAAAKKYIHSGFKAALAPMLHNIRDCDLLYGINDVIPKSGGPSPFPSCSEYMGFYEDFVRNFHHPDSHIQVMVGVNSPQRADEELLKISSELSHKFNLPVHCHLLETRWQRLSADQSISPLKKLDQFDLLGERTSLAHCVWMKENELDLIAGRKALAISNPTSNHFLGSGVFPVEKYLQRNIPVALGSDGVNCGTNHNMLEILRFFHLIQRNREPDYRRWISAKNGYKMITENGSSVLSFPRPSGEIKANYAADIVVADKNNFLDILDTSLPNQLVFHTSSLSVRHVLINGRFVMRDEKILGIMEDDLRKEIAERKTCLEKSMKSALKAAGQDKKPYRSAYQKLWLNSSE